MKRNARTRATDALWRALAVASVALLWLPAMPVVAQGPTPAATPVWWGPTEVGQGLHLRVPVTVHNPYEFAMKNAPVAAQMDLGKLLLEAGWVHAPSGERDVLQSFLLSLDSVRVVAMRNLQPPRPGTLDGTLRSVDPSLPDSDLRRYEVPSVVFPGFLDASQAHAFDARTNPVVTVLWEVPGALNPGQAQHFMVYFDTPFNREHAPADYSKSVPWNHVRSLYWSGSARELIGWTVPNAPGQAGFNVIGLHPKTNVTVYTDEGKGQFKLLQSAGSSNPFTLDKDQVFSLYTGQVPALVRLVADKPIIGYAIGTGFVPSLDAGMAGKEFIFAKTHPINWEDDPIHFISTGTQPTTIVVQPLVSDGSTYTFRLNHQTNPYPYNIDGRSVPGNFNPASQAPNSPQGFPGSCQYLWSTTTTPAPSLPPGPAVYRAVVVEGDPVLLQHSPTDGVYQVPSRLGGPLAREHYAATGFTDQTFAIVARPVAGGAPAPVAVCNPNSRVGGWYAAGLDQATNISVFSPDLNTQVFPTPPIGSPSAPPGPVQAAPAFGQARISNVLDRPLAFTTTPQGGQRGEEVVLFIGLDPAMTGTVFNTVANGAGAPGGYPNAFSSFTSATTPLVHGPLGGEAGRKFANLGPTIVYAPYNNTVVDADMLYSGSGARQQRLHLGPGASHAFTDGPQDFLYGIRIQSNKPLIAYPMKSNPTFLAAIPTFLAPTLGAAEFRGHLVDISSVTGLDPVAGSTTLGTPITYKLRVTNLGRAVGGGNLPDVVDLVHSPPPTGWTAVLDPPVMPTLASGESQDVHLTLTPGPNAAPTEGSFVTVRATSRGNPNMVDSVGVVTHIKRSFDVALWFDLGDFKPEGPHTEGTKAMTRGTTAGNATEYPIVLQNQGSMEDSITLETTPPAEGWQVLLLQNNQEFRQVQLAPGGATLFKLRVTPPPGVADGLLVTSVTAKSSSPAALDRVAATTKLSAPSDIILEALGHNRVVDPGAEATFSLRLRNVGRGSAEIRLGAEGDTIRGWTPVALSVRDPVSGQRINLTKVSLSPGDILPFEATTRSALHAPAGQTRGLRVAAMPLDGTRGDEALLYAQVRALHNVSVLMPPGPVVVALGDDNTTFTLRLANRGNLDEQLSWRIRTIPAGWELPGPENLLVPRNATQAFPVRLAVPRELAIGTYQVTVDLVSRDGTVRELLFPVAVGAHLRVHDAAPGGIEAQPGRVAETDVPVRNDGNVPVVVEVQSMPTEPWRIQGANQQILLHPGEDSVAQVGWHVPLDAPTGTSRHVARLLLTPQAADLEPSTRDVEVVVDVGKADLTGVAFRAYPGAAGTLVEGKVINNGNRPAYAFRVELLVGQEPVQELAIAEMAPGGVADVRLLVPPGQSGEVSVLVDALQSVVESDETNNLFTLDASEARAAPQAGILLALTLLALALVQRRRRGPSRRGGSG